MTPRNSVVLWGMAVIALCYSDRVNISVAIVGSVCIFNPE